MKREEKLHPEACDQDVINDHMEILNDFNAIGGDNKTLVND